MPTRPFIKVEATKFTEVGYVGRDVEQIVRDLVEVAIVADARAQAQGRAGARRSWPPRSACSMRWSARASSPATRDSFRSKLRAGELDDKEIEIETQSSGSGMPMFEIPGMPGAQIGAISIGDIFGKLGGRTKTRRLTVADSHEILVNEESDKLLDSDQLVQEAIDAVENNGIVFLDEIDKICARDGRIGGDVSREGVQRDLLPLIEGTTVSTKHGAVKTDHILFIASGAFHIAKPSDLLPELQGRLPIRVELKALTRDDFRRILTEPEASLIKQYVALLQTEGVTLDFTDDAIDAIADVAVAVNSTRREYRRAAAADGDGARARRDFIHRPRPPRRDDHDRCRLRAEARRRPRQERGSEPVYSCRRVRARCTRDRLRRIHTPSERASALANAVARLAIEHRYASPLARRLRYRARRTRTYSAPSPPWPIWASSKPTTSDAEFRQRQPVRHLTAQHAALGFGYRSRPLPVMTSTKVSAVVMGALQETEQRAMRPRLRHAVQVEPGVDLLAAARQMRPLAAADRRQRRRLRF